MESPESPAAAPPAGRRRGGGTRREGLLQRLLLAVEMRPVYHYHCCSNGRVRVHSSFVLALSFLPLYDS